MRSLSKPKYTSYSVLYFVSQNITWSIWPNNKMILSHHSIVVPLVCSGLFHSASFTVLFYIYIKKCTYIICWDQWEDNFCYTVPSIFIDNSVFYYCIMSIVSSMHACRSKWKLKINFSSVQWPKVIDVNILVLFSKEDTLFISLDKSTYCFSRELK